MRHPAWPVVSCPGMSGGCILLHHGAEGGHHTDAQMQMIER
jgi:hypothetical protein